MRKDELKWLLRDLHRGEMLADPPHLEVVRDIVNRSARLCSEGAMSVPVSRREYDIMEAYNRMSGLPVQPGHRCVCYGLPLIVDDEPYRWDNRTHSMVRP